MPEKHILQTTADTHRKAYEISFAESSNMPDIYDTKRRYEIEKKKIECEDKNKILEFLKRMELSGMSNVQLLKYCFAIRDFLKTYNKKHILETTEKDLENYLISIQKLKPSTRKTRWYSLKKFFDFCDRGELFKKFKIRFEQFCMKLPEEILTEEEIVRMIDNTNSERNRIFISLLYESGCRISELLTRKVRNVRFDSYGALLHIGGKSGERVVRIVKCAGELKEFILERHPNEPMFNMSYPCAKKMLTEVARKSGIQKNVYPHLFRHSRATHLASQLTEQQLKKFFGWSGASRMAGVYVHLSAKDIDKAILKLNGIEVEDELERMKKRGVG